ncbi:ankyrin repeat domain-containing protein 36C-like [Macrobrachium nipponense]|uniref:ankyrin repeat domain-containing protein 36C-like n=1 Tax=Macrobrachium nipponense TaxID=159736 RepID=UPI0030C8B335
MDYYFLDKDGENSKSGTVDVGKGGNSDEDFPKEIVYPSSTETEVSSSCSDINKSKVDEMEEAENSSNMNNSPEEEQEVLGSSDEQIMRIISDSHENESPDAGVNKNDQVQEDENAFESTRESILKNVIDAGSDGTHEENEPASENAVNMCREENCELDETLPALDHITTDEESSKSNISSEVASSQDKVKSPSIFDSFCNENSDITTSQGSSYSDTSNKEDKESSFVPENPFKSKKLRRNNNFDSSEKKDGEDSEKMLADKNINVTDHDREITSPTQVSSTPDIQEVNQISDSHEEKELLNKEYTEVSKQDSEEKSKENKTEECNEMIQETKDNHEGSGLGTTEDSHESNGLPIKEYTREGDGMEVTEDKHVNDGLATTGDSFEGNDLGPTDENDSLVEGENETKHIKKTPVIENMNEPEVTEGSDKLAATDNTDSTDFREGCVDQTKANNTEYMASPNISLDRPDANNKRNLVEGDENTIKKFKAGTIETKILVDAGSNFKGLDAKDVESSSSDALREEITSNQCDEETETTVDIYSRDTETSMDIENKTVNGLEHEPIESSLDAEERSLLESEISFSSKSQIEDLSKSQAEDSSKSPTEDSSDTHTQITKHSKESEKTSDEPECDEMNDQEEGTNQIEDLSKDKMSRSEETLEESSSRPEAEDKKQKEASSFDACDVPEDSQENTGKAVPDAGNVPEDSQENTGDTYLDYDEESIENISRTIRSFSNEKSSPKISDNRNTNQKDTTVSKRVIIVKTAPNVEKVKRKLEEILERSKGEEDAAIAELQRMKKEKTDILNAITTEMEKLKSMLVKGKQG